MLKTSFVPLLILLTVGSAEAQTRLGGCARGSEQGYVRVVESDHLVFWRGGDRAVAVEPGDELRLCRFERDKAILTLGGFGLGYVLPRTSVGSEIIQPTVREVTTQDVACVGPQIEALREGRTSNEQDFALLDLSRRLDIPLPMIYQIRLRSAMLLPEQVPTCEQTD